MNLWARTATLAASSVFLLTGCGQNDSATNDHQGPVVIPSDSSTDGSTSGDAHPSDAHPLDVSVVDSGGKDAVAVEAGLDAVPGDALPDVNFGYDAPPPPTAWDQLPPKCADAAEKGVVWLVSQQKVDGSWGTADPYRLAATGLAVVKLETYAIEKGMYPFDPAYKYRDNVVKGLTYLFKILVTKPMSGVNDTNGDLLGVTSAQTNYINSIILMAVTAGRGTTEVVNSPGSKVDGWTYAKVAQDMVDYFAGCQVASQGGWRYTCPSSNADNSVTQYVSLALEYGEHPNYQFLCTIPPAVSTGLWTWVGSIQNMTAGANYGGSGYTTSTNTINPYKTGALLQELAFLNQGVNTVKAQAALDYLNKNWASSLAGNPAYYMEMWAIMKGLVAQGVTMVGAHDWYQEYCDLLVAQQLANGSWPLSKYDNAQSDAVLSSTWALLILEKAAPPPQ